MSLNSKKHSFKVSNFFFISFNKFLLKKYFGNYGRIIFSIKSNYYWLL